MSLFYTEPPLISIIIPCYNEEIFLGKCINSVLNNDYPLEKVEIFIVNGMSTDKTVEVAQEIIKSNSEVKIEILNNPKKIFPCAVNIGVNNSHGEFIMILGAHSVYNKSYITLCVENSLKYDADNVGGILETIGTNTSVIGRAITCVLSSSFGVGNSTFRTGTDKVTEVDTVFGGCYKRKVFEKIGFFNENLRSTSDMDFNVRLKKAGGRIILDPGIKATYFTRNSFGKFFSNNIRNGYWSIYPLRFIDYLPVSMRHMIPLFFICSVICGIILSFVANIFMYILLGVMIIYTIAAFVAATPFIKKGVFNIILMPFLFLTLHLTYGAGSLWAGIKVIYYKTFGFTKKHKV
jgi:glycosyltransferase involved in cell wall biosynthesis